MDRNLTAWFIKQFPPGVTIVPSNLGLLQAESFQAEILLTWMAYRYGELETGSFSEALATVMLPDATSADPEAAVAALGAAAAAAEAAMAAAIDRCRAATGLTALPELLLVADEELSQYVGRLQVSLSGCSKQYMV